MSRRTARELAFKLIFQLEIQREDSEEQVATFFEDNEASDKEKTYILDVIRGIKSNIKEIDKDIEKYLKGWKINRISKVDLSILRLAVYEIINRDDIPSSVSINEAIELAKKYSGEEAGAFVNGILGKFIRDKAAIQKETQT